MDKTEHLTPMPMIDKKQRKAVDESIGQRFITPEEFNERLNGVMITYGIKSDTELAWRMGVTHSRVYNIRKKGSCSMGTLKRLAVALDVTVNFLLEKNYDMARAEKGLEKVPKRRGGK